MKKFNLKRWRFINEVSIIGGILLPWIKIIFDAQSDSCTPTPGWRFIFRLCVDVVNDFFANGFELFMLLFLLIGLSGFVVIIYLIFNLFSMKKGVNQPSNKTISFILISTVLVFSSLLFFGKPMLGYWLTNTGLLSGAVLEWGIIQTTKPPIGK